MSDSYYLMVIGPHPDDSEFGIAGTVARLVNEGKKVVYVICTNGNKGSSERKMTSEKLVKIREKEQRAAAGVLGVTEVVFLGFGDQELEDNTEFRKALVRVIRQYRPHVVATTDPYRKYMQHRDHRITGQVAADAVYPYARDHMAYPDLIKEGYQPHKVREMWFWGTDDPNLRLDITDTFEKKLAALSCHKSQLDVGPELRKRLLTFATTNAQGEKFKLAEAFHRIELRY
ncbi:MAG TPA: PIG-L deacetylase family protein [Dehalococcoidales bacterium]|nr:PIG-L deacetylase family protein [Dehalococcoidales bacterium]